MSHSCNKLNKPITLTARLTTRSTHIEVDDLKPHSRAVLREKAVNTRGSGGPRNPAYK
jgi:acyl dehydratase